MKKIFLPLAIFLISITVLSATLGDDPNPPMHPQGVTQAGVSLDGELHPPQMSVCERCQITGLAPLISSTTSADRNSRSSGNTSTSEPGGITK